MNDSSSSSRSLSADISPCDGLFLIRGVTVDELERDLLCAPFNPTRALLDTLADEEGATAFLPSGFLI